MNDPRRYEQVGISFTQHDAHICVWAPFATSVALHTYSPERYILLEQDRYGYWCSDTQDIIPGQHYHFHVDGVDLPDPASRSQPDGVHGISAAVDLEYAWTDHGFEAPSLRELIIYELHVGTFTRQGDFEGVLSKLPYLQSLGINAIEIMPIAQFPGARNWGYDGVYPFAVQESYGGARAFQHLVDACHAQGIAVIVDVVYNHVGPEGNHFPAFGPYFTDKYHTPWGAALNYDDAWSMGMRDFVCSNVCMWLQDFHVDGLRLDAVHAIKDASASHILQDIRHTVDHLMIQTGRTYYLIGECDLNDRRYLEPLGRNGLALDGQWLDEFHHALRVSVGEEPKGYYSEFTPIASLAKALQDAYVFDGCFSPHRKKFFGSRATGIAGERFVVFSQNHDQVGNRMLGERSSHLYTSALQKLMAMTVLFSPFTPLLFMGEEWGATSPFLYFVSHSDSALIEAVRSGRKKEFKAFQQTGEIPDPQDEETFRRSILVWDELDIPRHQHMFAYYQALIAFRKSVLLSTSFRREDIHVDSYPDAQIIALYIVKKHETLLCLLNFRNISQHVSIRGAGSWRKIWDSAAEKWGGHSITPDESQRTVLLSAQSGAVFCSSEGISLEGSPQPLDDT